MLFVAKFMYLFVTDKYDLFVEWWQWQTAALGEKTNRVPVPVSPPRIPDDLACEWNPASVAGGR